MLIHLPLGLHLLAFLLSSFLLPLVCSYALPEQQYVLSTGREGERDGHGILRRFDSRDVDLQDVLQIAEDNDLDIWQVTPEHIDIYFPPPPHHSRAVLSHPSQLYDYPHSSTHIPVAPPSHSSPSTLDANWTTLPPLTSPYHASYHPLFEIESFLHELEREQPELVSVFRAGISGEGREVVGIKISREERDNEKRKARRKGWNGNMKKGNMKKGEKMGFVITGAQHAREWVATATSLYLTHALVTTPSTNASEPDNGSLSSLLDKYDFYIIPAPNPDGYDFTWESDRFWYKNRMKTSPDSTCVGVDMNRNWGFKWKPTVSLTSSFNASQTLPTKSKSKKPKKPAGDPCSQWYPGNRPFQAPEVNHIASYIETLPNLKAFVDLRSYGQMLSSPFSYSCKKYPRDAEDQLEAALGAVSALRQPYGTSFMTGTLCSMFYRAHGNIVDWMYKRAGIKYSYAAHLRDTGTYGFALPPHLIRPVGEETAKMIEYLADFIALIEK